MAIPFCTDNKSGFEWTLQNTGAGTKVAITNTAAVASGNSARILAIANDCTGSATPSVTMYNMGASAH